MLSHTLALLSLEGGLDQAMLQELLRQWGYGVIFGAMLLENAGVPLPGKRSPSWGATPPVAASSTCLA